MLVGDDAGTSTILGGAHHRVHPDGSLPVRVRGQGPALVVVRSARPVGTRWLGGARPRLVRFGARRVQLVPGRTETITFRLSQDRLALLHRMQTVRVTISVTTAAGVSRRRGFLHAPARHSTGQ